MKSNDMFYEVCHYCCGKGYLENEGYAECPYCDGTGIEEDILSCTYCEDDFEDVLDCDNVEGGCGCCPYDEPICKVYFEDVIDCDNVEGGCGCCQYNGTSYCPYEETICY